MVVYEAESSGALCVAIPVTLTASDVAWSGKHTALLVKADGEVKQRTIDDLKAIFQLDLADPFSLEDIENPSNFPFEIVGEHQEYAPPDKEPVTVFKIQFMNPVGGGQKMPEQIDRKQALAKWGAKFRAVGTVKKAAAPAKAAATTATAAAPAKKPASAGPPSRKATGASARTSTQEEVWTALVGANPSESQDKLGEMFYTAQDKVKPNANGELSITEWGKVADELGL